MTQKLLISLNSEKKNSLARVFFSKKILLLPVSLIARFYYIKNLVAGLFSLIARILLLPVLLLPGSTVPCLIAINEDRRETTYFDNFESI